MKKKILIIGASSGIGKELALSYANSGNIVGITGRRVELLEQIYITSPQNIFYAKHDISKKFNEDVFSDIVNRMGGIDLLIITAGVDSGDDGFKWENEKNVIDVNVIGFAEIVNIGYNYFLKRKGGHIVGISSIAGIRGIDTCPAYSASKAFVSNYLESLRKKNKKMKNNILVTDISPGFVDTQMAKGNGLFWVASVKKATRQIINAIDSKKEFAYITKRWALIAFILIIMPRKMYDKIF